MRSILLRRLVEAVPTVALVVTIVFVVVRVVPGDPVAMMLGDSALPADAEALRAELGLDRPLGHQYVGFLAALGRGDLGRSIHFGRPVVALLAEHLVPTLELAAAALAAAILVSLPLGLVAALWRDRWPDHLARFLGLAGVSIPNFWLGPMLILWLSIGWNLLPVSGRGGWTSLVLPAVTLGTGLAGLLTRMVRTTVADELRQPYVTALAGRGIARWRAVSVHALKNALIPIVTVVGLQFGSLLTGAIITESIFAWPGLGRLLIQSIRRRDYPLLQGGILLIAVTYVLVNLATDLLYARLDPRLRRGSR